MLHELQQYTILTFGHIHINAYQALILTANRAIEMLTMMLLQLMKQFVMQTKKASTKGINSHEM